MSITPQKEDNYFGSVLLFKTVEDAIVKKPDVLVVAVHYVLIKDANLRCVGLGDSKTLEEDEIGSELLPDDWNVDESRYALRYSYGKDLYILLGHITENMLIINFLNVQKKSASNICFEPEELVKVLKGSLRESIPTADSILKRIKKELIDPVYSGVTNEMSTQTSDQEPKQAVTIGENRPRGQFLPSGLEPRPFGFPDIGRSDLNPLGVLGSGMLLDYRHIGRYDPISPMGPCTRTPNPDHFQPPGFGPHFI